MTLRQLVPVILLGELGGTAVLATRNWSSQIIVSRIGSKACPSLGLQYRLVQAFEKFRCPVQVKLSADVDEFGDSGGGDDA